MWLSVSERGTGMGSPDPSIVYREADGPGEAGSSVGEAF